jgi:predicted  nucleic acid-binding Zn-ribbon protein
MGKDAFDGLTSAAVEADKAVAPLAAKIEEARKAGQTAIVIQLETKAVDDKITATESTIKKLTAQRNSVKLDADKKYFQDKIDAAEKTLARLKREKANIPIDAKIDKLTGKIATAHNKLNNLDKKSANPEVKADIAKFTKARNKAIHDLAVLTTKKANPKLDTNSKAFKTKVAEAERKLKATDKKSATVDIKATDHASSKFATVDQKRKNLDGKSANVNITTTYHTKGKKGTTADIGPGATMMPPPPAPVINLAGPQITIHLRDERLADLIDVRVDGKAARAAHVVGRRRGVLL